MNKFTLVPMVTAISVAMAVSAQDASAWDSTIPGASCVPENAKSQMGKLRFHNGAVKNAGGTGVTVICPIEVDGDPKSIKATVNLKNYGNGTKSVNCAVREIAPNGAQLQSLDVSKSGMGAQSAASISKTLDVRNDGSSVIVRCSLPPQFGLVSVTASFDGDSGGGNPPATNAMACVTTADKDYLSSDTTVYMRNGAILNNYNGEYYLDNYEYMMYRTESGEWHTLENDKYMNELDIIQEPTSCFEPALYTVKSIYDVGDTTEVLISGGYTYSLDSNCKGTSEGHLLYWQSSNSEYSVVRNINTGNWCYFYD